MGTFVIKKTDTGHVFHLVAVNREIIGTSQVYSSKQSCEEGIQSVKHNAGVHVEDQTKEGYETLADPKYVIYVDKGEAFRFRLIAHNGKEILASQAYTSKESCKKGIESVKNNAPDAEIKEEE